MPSASGQIGRPRALTAPRTFIRRRPFRSAALSTKNESITGVTRDANGNTLGFCVVQLFRTPSDVLVREVASDAAGNYAFDNPGSGPFYIVAYKTGVPDVAGTTVNTIIAV